MTDSRRAPDSTGWIVLLLIIVGLSVVVAGSATGQSADIVVDTDGNGDYTSIQHAVENASDTARIKVEAGTYNQDVDVYKNVTIDAPNGATISNGSAAASADGLRIAGNASPTVSGVTLTGWSDGINAYQTTGDWAIVDATVTNVDDGVIASESTGDWRIDGTTIEDTDSQGILTADSAGDWVVTGTTITNIGRIGIVPYGSSGNWTVSSTTIRNTSDDGIDAYKSDTARIRDVTITNVSNEGIIIGDTDGDWIIEDTVVRQAGRIGINGEQLNASSDPIIRNTTVAGAGRGIEMSKSQGDWKISNSTVANIARSGVYASESMGGGTIQQLTVRNASDGIVFYNSSDDWTVTDSTISRVSDNGLDVSYSSGDWQVRDTTIRNASRGGIVTVGSTGVPVIENTVIRDVVVGIDIKNATGDWTARNVSIQDAENVGIYANRTAGDWLVTESSLTNIGIVALQAGKTEGQWQINESIITNGNANATGARGAAIEGNASYNYWGAADGPGGMLNGSGGKVRGNLEVTPFYTDASLTTLSSKIGNDSDSGSQNGSTGFVDVAASDLAGSGTAADPYIITNASELQAMEDDSDAHYELGNDIDASGTVNWNNGSGYRPAGPFAGSLDGADHVVTGLYINRSSDNFVGLISSFDGSGSVSDIGIEQADVSGAYATGPLVGSVSSNGTVTDSYATGTASGSTVGGLVGVVDNIGTVNDSYASTTITDSNRAGGLVGQNSLSATVTDSYATGAVNGESNVGGLLGHNNDNATVSNSYATGMVNGFKNVGGLVGDIEESSSVQQSYATGMVNGSDAIGGLAGTILDNEGSSPTVTDSYATGDVSGSVEVGGLVGKQVRGTTIINKTYASGNVSGSSEVGGLVGKQVGNAIVVQSYATGNVSGSRLTGGLVGRQLDDDSVSDSYWDTDATGQIDSAGSAKGLSTTQMTGAAAETNMTEFAFGTTWETQPNDYPTLIGTDVPTTTQVQLSNVQLQPANVGSPANHTLSFTMSGVSADGQTDTIDITLPDGVTVVNVSSARSTDTDYGVTITSQQNPIELAVDPDDTAGTVSLDVEVALRLKAAGI